MRAVCLVLALSLLPALTRAVEGEHAGDRHHTDAVPRGGELIRITINPEARVSVTMNGEMPASVPCGTAVDLPVRIVNHGFVTAQLEAQWVGEAPRGARLEFDSGPLSGMGQELRNLRIYLPQPGPTDLTIVFKARDDVPDLGGRSRVHFLISCSTGN